MFMNVAHGLDRVDNDARVVKGSHWIMSNKSSAGSTESIVRILVEVRQSQGRSAANFAVWLVTGRKSPPSRDHNSSVTSEPRASGADHFQLPRGQFQLSPIGLVPDQTHLTVLLLASLASNLNDARKFHASMLSLS